MRPPFKITSESLSLSLEITRLLGQFEGLKLSIPQPVLNRKNRIKTIHSSLAIEGNRLTEDQVSAIIDNKRVIGPAKDILEVKNAIEAYNQVHAYRAYDLKSLLKAHKTMMSGLIEDAGSLRQQNVGVFKGSNVAHMAPKYTLVPKLMGDLFSFLKNDKETHPLIKSCVFHYEFEFIHPFSDGNGRTGRLWQSTILTHFHSIFEFVPVESIIHQKKKDYYQALAASDKAGESTAFIAFILKAIYQAMQDLLLEFKPSPQKPTHRIEQAKLHFKKRLFTRKEYILFHKTMSTATASRDLSLAVRKKILLKSGVKALTAYRFM